MTVGPLSNLLRERPIVITGVGCSSAAGNSVASLWDAAMDGKSLATWREFQIAGCMQRFAVSAAPELDATDPDLHSVRRMDRCVQLAWLSAREAWSQSGLDGISSRAKIGVIVGSSRGPDRKS